MLKNQLRHMSTQMHAGACRSCIHSHRAARKWTVTHASHHKWSLFVRNLHATCVRKWPQVARRISCALLLYISIVEWSCYSSCEPAAVVVVVVVVPGPLSVITNFCPSYKSWKTEPSGGAVYNLNFFCNAFSISGSMLWWPMCCSPPPPPPPPALVVVLSKGYLCTSVLDNLLPWHGYVQSIYFWGESRQ